MQTSKKLSIVSLFCFLTIAFSGAYSALGKPDWTDECGTSGCHTPDSLMTITSNATGTVNVEVGNQFSLVINAASLDTGAQAGKMAVTVLSGWSDNNQFSFTDQSIIDNEVGDSNANDVEITTTFTFSALAVGSWTLRIWTAASKGDAGRISQSLDVSVSVTASSDTTPPTIDSPTDLTISEGDSLKNITWIPSDANPSSYEIFDDSLSWQSGTWDGSSIITMLDTLTLGTHNITLAVWDIASNSVWDQVDVTVVDGTDPTVDSPVVPDIVEGTPGNLITWSPYDLHPSSYTIYRDEVVVKSGQWNSSSETISLSMDGLSLGTYNITIIVFDTTSRTARNTLFVTVFDGTFPTVDNPSDIDYPEGDTGFSIMWSPSDLHPVSYEILREGVQVKSGAWNTTSETMTIVVDGLSIGTYNYTIALVDVGGNMASDEVTVTVFSADVPSINQPADQIIMEGSVGLEIIWNPLDLNPATYSIYQNEILVKSGLWNSSAETISFSLDGLAFGSFNFTAVVKDLDSNIATDEVWVTVIDGTLPVVDSPIDISYIEGETGNSVTWNPSDLHPLSYEIYKDGMLVKSGLWNSSSESISISVDGLTPGVYNFSIRVTDVGGLSAIDQVDVDVQIPSSSTTPTTTSTPTQTTTTETPPASEAPLESILTIVLTWIVTGVLVFALAEILVRRSRG